MLVVKVILFIENHQQNDEDYYATIAMIQPIYYNNDPEIGSKL